MTKRFCWQINVSDWIHKLILRCVSSVLIALVYFGCEMCKCKEKPTLETVQYFTNAKQLQTHP